MTFFTECRLAKTEFTVQRAETLFDHITGLRQISVAFGFYFRQREVAAGFVHNAVRQPMFFQMLSVLHAVVAFNFCLYSGWFDR